MSEVMNVGVMNVGQSGKPVHKIHLLIGMAYDDECMLRYALCYNIFSFSVSEVHCF